MVSEKMKVLVKNSSAIRAMFEDGKIMAEKYGKENVYDFSLGNPSIVPPPSVKKAINDVVAEVPEIELHGYMNNSGFEDVRTAIANHINKTHGMDYNVNNIIMTVGAAGGLNVAFKAVLNPGDEVIIIAPFFGEYLNYISNYDAVPVIVSPDKERFSIKFDEFEQKISDKTKFVIINSPNNPTGTVYTEEDIKRVADILEKKQQEFGTQIYLIADEPYREVVFSGVEVPYIPKFYKNTIVGYSYAKSISLPGERIGYLAVNTDIDGFEELLGALNTANRILGFVNAPSLMQKVIARVQGETADISVYEENRNILYKALKEYGYDVVEPGGTFYMFPKALIDNDEEFCAAAKGFRLVIVPGSSFGCPGYFRIAFCVDKQTVINSLDSFKKLAEKYKA